MPTPQEHLEEARTLHGRGEFKKGMKTFDNYIELKLLLEKLFKRRVDLVIPQTIKPHLKNKKRGELI